MASFYDSFSRADNPAAIGTSDSGLTWTNVFGTMGILSGKVYNPSGVLAQSTVDLGYSDVAWRVQIGTTATASAVVVRATDANNYFYIRVNSGQYDLSKLVAGVFSHLTTGGIATGSDSLCVICNGSKLTLYVNGVFAWTYTDTFNQTATKFGVRCSDTATRFTASAAQPPVASGTSWYVAPAGTYLGDGSLIRPWDWRTSQTVVNGLVQGGDTEWVRGGNHGTSGDPLVYPTIGAGALLPVQVRRYPGDGWPRIFTGLNLSPGNAPFVTYWILQFIQNNVNRINNYRGDNPTYGDGGIVLEAPGCEFHYCIVANNAMQAWFWGEQALGSLVHMCLTYYNGFRDLFNGLPAVQGFYRQSDDNGTGLYQTMDTCITCLNYQSGMQIYGSGASKLQYAKTFNSLFFYGGYLGASYASGQAIREILLGSTSTFVHSDKCYFDRDWLWPQPNTSAAQLGYNGKDNTFVSFTNGVVKDQFEIQYFRNLELTGNLFVQQTFNGLVDEVRWDSTIGAKPAAAGGGIDNNSWAVANDGNVGNHGPFLYNDGVSDHRSLTPATWYTAIGYEQHSALVLPSVVPTQVAVMRNTVEPTALWPTPRAYVFVFNFQGQPTVSIDPSACLATDDEYAIYDWGAFELDSPTPIATGVYRGVPIVLSLGTQLSPPINANQTSRAQHDIPPALNVGNGSMPGAYILAKTGVATPPNIGILNKPTLHRYLAPRKLTIRHKR